MYFRTLAGLAEHQSVPQLAIGSMISVSNAVLRGHYKVQFARHIESQSLCDLSMLITFSEPSNNG
jgi:hypothetical protein